jgi:gliding motility-associated-like protein
MATANAGSDFDPSTATYTWSGPDGFQAEGNPVDLTNSSAGIYEVTVSTIGCSTSAEIAISGTACAIPNGISPNGDGSNDNLDLTGLDVLELKIFSRYGNVVFEQQQYTDQWHGQDFKNRELPAATYYYYARMASGLEKTGWVYVIRTH